MSRMALMDGSRSLSLVLSGWFGRKKQGRGKILKPRLISASKKPRKIESPLFFGNWDTQTANAQASRWTTTGDVPGFCGATRGSACEDSMYGRRRALDTAGQGWVGELNEAPSGALCRGPTGRDGKLNCLE
jgi:hypothetical protein